MLVHNSHATEHGPDNTQIALIRARNKEVRPGGSAALNLDWATVHGSTPFFRKSLNGHGREAVLKDRTLGIIAKDLTHRSYRLPPACFFKVPVLLPVGRCLLPEVIIGRIGHPNLGRCIVLTLKPLEIIRKADHTPGRINGLGRSMIPQLVD